MGGRPCGCVGAACVGAVGLRLPIAPIGAEARKLLGCGVRRGGHGRRLGVQGLCGLCAWCPAARTYSGKRDALAPGAIAHAVYQAHKTARLVGAGPDRPRRDAGFPTADVVA